MKLAAWALALSQIVSQAGSAHIWGYIDIYQTTMPSGPTTGQIRIYAKDKAGVAELFYKNGAGTERDMSATGGGGVSDGDKGDITVTQSGAQWDVDAGAVGAGQLSDDLSCTGLQVVRRNSGDTAFECATPASGSGPTRVTQTTDVTTTSNTVYSAASGLSFAVNASTNYHAECRFYTSTAVGTTGLQIQTTGPGSPTRVRIMRRYLNNSATVSAFTSQTAFNSTSTDDGAAGSHATANFIHVSEVDLMLEIGGSGGTVAWAIESEVSASSVTLYKGSFCEYQSY